MRKTYRDTMWWASSIAAQIENKKRRAAKIRFGLWDTKENRFLLTSGGPTLVRLGFKTLQAATDEITFLRADHNWRGLEVKPFEANDNEL